MKKLLITLSVAAIGSSSIAGDKLLKPEEAFKSSIKVIKSGVYEINYSIADGYQLYKDKFKVLVGTVGDNSVLISLPDHDTHERYEQSLDKNVKYYKNNVIIRIEVPKNFSDTADVQIQAQGCEATKGVCYPPFTVNISKASSSPTSFLDFIASKFSSN